MYNLRLIMEADSTERRDVGYRRRLSLQRNFVYHQDSWRPPRRHCTHLYCRRWEASAEELLSVDRSVRPVHAPGLQGGSPVAARARRTGECRRKRPVPPGRAVGVRDSSTGGTGVPSTVRQRSAVASQRAGHSALMSLETAGFTAIDRGPVLEDLWLRTLHTAAKRPFLGPSPLSNDPSSRILSSLAFPIRAATHLSRPFMPVPLHARII